MNMFEYNIVFTDNFEERTVKARGISHLHHILSGNKYHYPCKGRSFILVGTNNEDDKSYVKGE